MCDFFRLYSSYFWSGSRELGLLLFGKVSLLFNSLHSVVLPGNKLRMVLEELLLELGIPEVVFSVHEHLHVLIEALHLVHAVIVHLVNSSGRRVVGHDLEMVGFVNILHDPSEGADSLHEHQLLVLAVLDSCDVRLESAFQSRDCMQRPVPNDPTKSEYMNLQVVNVIDGMHEVGVEVVL